MASWQIFYKWRFIISWENHRIQWVDFLGSHVWVPEGMKCNPMAISVREWGNSTDPMSIHFLDRKFHLSGQSSQMFTCNSTTLHSITLNYTTLHYTSLHYTTLHNTSALHYTTRHDTTQIALHYTTLHYPTPHCITLHYITLHSSHHHKCNCNYTTRITLHHNYNSTTLQLQLQLHYTTLHCIQQLWVRWPTRWPLQPLQPLQKTQLQPPFGPSVDSLCHPWFTTTNLSYRFPIFETSATALYGTTGMPSIKVISAGQIPNLTAIGSSDHTMAMENCEKSANRWLFLFLAHAYFDRTYSFVVQLTTCDLEKAFE